MEKTLVDYIYDLYDESPSWIKEGGVCGCYTAIPHPEGTLIRVFKYDGNILERLIRGFFIEEDEGYVLDYNNEEYFY